jgi:hypothetical protein
MDPRLTCKMCSKQMQVTARVPPIGGTSGLLVFLCLDCDRSDTVLVEADRWDEVAGWNDRTEEGS